MNNNMEIGHDVETDPDVETGPDVKMRDIETGPDVKMSDMEIGPDVEMNDIETGPDVEMSDIETNIMIESSIPYYVFEKRNQLLSAIKITYFCNQDTREQWKKTTANKIYACGYTAPTMAISMLFLEHNNVSNISELKAKIPENVSVIIDGTCKTIPRRKYITGGINEATGYLFNHHLMFNAGIDYLVQNTSSLFTHTINQGVNLISFINPELENYTVHHAFIYLMTDNIHCFVLDSWCENDDQTQHSRLPVLRIHLVNEIKEVLKQILELSSSSADEVQHLMQRYFISPGIKSFRKLIPVVLNQRYLIEVAKHGFYQGCHGRRSWGGKYKTKRKKSKKILKRKKSRKVFKKNKKQNYK